MAARLQPVVTATGLRTSFGACMAANAGEGRPYGQRDRADQTMQILDEVFDLDGQLAQIAPSTQAGQGEGDRR